MGLKIKLIALKFGSPLNHEVLSTLSMFLTMKIRKLIPTLIFLQLLEYKKVSLNYQILISQI